MVKEVDGRVRIDSDLDLTRAFGGCARFESSGISSNPGSGSNSLPGRYMLSCRGRKPPPRPFGISTLLKSKGVPIVGRRDTLGLVALLALLDALDARVRPSAIHCAGR